MRKIQLGIAYEGSADIDALKIILKRVLNSCDLDFDIDAVYPQTPGSGIVGYVAAYAKRFSDSRVDLPVYCTDQDDGKRSRRDIIRKKLKAATPAMLDASVIGVSIPHFEAWLIADESAVKAILGLDGNEHLPLDSLQPKDRLTSLYQNRYEGEASLSIIRCRIAERMNIGQVERNKTDFNAFVRDIRNAANVLKST